MMTKEQIEAKIKEIEEHRQKSINDFEVSKGNIRYFEGVLDALRTALMDIPEEPKADEQG